jgi:Ser/Thr protein kinase RdoA (MazF antagonist)
MEKPLLRCDRQRIHGDCHFGNLLWGADGPFWVDFDDMLCGPRVQDVWLLLPGRDDYALAKRRRLLTGYQTMLEFDVDELRMIEGLRGLRMLHFSAWIGRRWDDPAFRRVFSHFDSRQYWDAQARDLATQLELLSQDLNS